MLVYEYMLKLFSTSGEVVKTIRSRHEFTENDIEEILKNHKQNVMYCEKTQCIRLHSDHFYKED